MFGLCTETLVIKCAGVPDAWPFLWNMRISHRHHTKFQCASCGTYHFLIIRISPFGHLVTRRVPLCKIKMSSRWWILFSLKNEGNTFQLDPSPIEARNMSRYVTRRFRHERNGNFTRDEKRKTHSRNTGDEYRIYRNISCRLDNMCVYIRHRPVWWPRTSPGSTLRVRFGDGRRRYKLSTLTRAQVCPFTRQQSYFCLTAKLSNCRDYKILAQLPANFGAQSN